MKKVEGKKIGGGGTANSIIHQKSSKINICTIEGYARKYKTTLI